MPVTEELLKAASEADVSLVIIGRTAGEDQDNSDTEGSYRLQKEEENLIKSITEVSRRTVVLINSGNIIDMSWVNRYHPQGVLYVWQGGQEGGNGVADILIGRQSPSGKLTDTIAEKITDYPSTTGVCKWCKNPENVRFTLSVLERLAHRYGSYSQLFGIEVLNEPISFSVFMTSPSRSKTRDKKEAKGSSYVPFKFLKAFYRKAYQLLRKHMSEEKVIVFHEGFRLGRWKKFFSDNDMKNVMLDTHIYIFAMESFVPFHNLRIYQIYINLNKWLLKRVGKYTPVFVGEWCISNRLANNCCNTEKAAVLYRQIADMQMEAWAESAGYFYWNYQLGRDTSVHMDEHWKESWDLRRCWNHQWITHS